MLNIPIAVLLLFPAPNYVDPPERGGGLNVLVGILTGTLFLTVGLRYYLRIFIKHGFGLDDFFIGLALLSSIAFGTVIVLGAQDYGGRRHVWDIPLSMVDSTLKCAFALKILFPLTTIFTRASLLCFYARIVQNSGHRAFTRALYLAHAFNATTGLTMLCLAVFQCTPISAYWDFPLPGPYADYCLDETSTILASGVLNCVADLLVIALPMKLVHSLQMPSRQRTGIMLLLGLGLLVSIISIPRTYYMVKTLQGYDETWLAFPLWVVATVEIDAGVFFACLPSLRPLVGLVCGKMRGWKEPVDGQPVVDGQSELKMHAALDASVQLYEDLNYFEAYADPVVFEQVRHRLFCNQYTSIETIRANLEKLRNGEELTD